MTRDVSLRERLTDRNVYARFFKTLKYALYVIVHPFDGFWDLTHEKRGSLAAANFIVFLSLLARILRLQYTSFLFINVYWPRVNIFQQIIAVLLPLAVFCLGNWGLTTLFDGKGRLKDVYIGTAYALTPTVLLQLPMIVLSNIITTDEGAFYMVLDQVSLIWTGFLILIAMMMIHDYSFGKTILFTVMSIFSMLVIIFLILLFFNLVINGINYFVSLYREITFRLY